MLAEPVRRRTTRAVLGAPAEPPSERELRRAEALLEQAAEAQPSELPRSEELARQALEAVEGIGEERLAGRADAVKARALVLIAGVRRLEGDAEAADERFREAAFHLTGPPDCPQRAFYCRHLALLRQEQGRLDEAAGLLWRAARIHRENGETREQGHCLAQLGFLFLEAGQIDRALPLLTRACQALRDPRDLELYVRCSLALAAYRER